MKPKEFYEIMVKFVEDDKRWRAMKVGDTIYDEQTRWGDIDYHKMIIDEIDIEERQIKAHDVGCEHSATLRGFLTQEEFNKL